LCLCEPTMAIYPLKIYVVHYTFSQNTSNRANVTLGDEDTCKLSYTLFLILCLCVAFFSYIVSFNRYVCFILLEELDIIIVVSFEAN